MAIDDFGKKIGGARKDLWKDRGLSIEDLLEFNDAERLKFIKKDNVWKKPDYEKMVSEGIPVRAAYFIKLIRDSLPVKPVLEYTDNSEEAIIEKQNGYITFVGKMRDAALSLKTEDDVREFYQNNVAPYITQRSYSRYVDVLPEAYGCVTNKLLRCTQVAEKSFRDIDQDIKKKQFCYSEDEKLLVPYQFLFYQEDRVKFKQDYRQRDMMEVSQGFGTTCFYPDEKWMNPKEWEDNTFFILKGRTICGRNFESLDAAKQFILDSIKEKLNEKNDSLSKVPKKKQRKRAFIPKQLAGIKRTGPDVRGNVSVTGQDYLNVFGFRGGEFGNWLNEKDRQASLDFGYESFLDLSRALDISPGDLSLGGRLSIAFGSRGHAGALAHYEPLREVINLTKMKGAGSLAHEWSHALDDIIGKKLGVGDMMTKQPNNHKIPESLRHLIDSLRYKEVCDDAALSSQKATVKLREKQLREYVNHFFISVKDEELIKKKEMLINALIADAPASQEKCGMFIMFGEEYSEILAISDFLKKETGRVIPKSDRIEIARYVDRLRGSIEQVGTSRMVKTDFYNDSIKFDKIHSKTDHGYWQSSVEMFARAFACYINDKLAEKGERSDYLCGHSELASSCYIDRDGNSITVNAIPIGEERKIINNNFDRFFEELKFLELLHPLEKLPEVSSLENHKWKSSLDLDDRIQKAKGTILENTKEKKDFPPLYENTNGQLQFIFH